MVGAVFGSEPAYCPSGIIRSGLLLNRLPSSVHRTGRQPVGEPPQDPSVLCVECEAPRACRVLPVGEHGVSVRCIVHHPAEGSSSGGLGPGGVAVCVLGSPTTDCSSWYPRVPPAAVASSFAVTMIRF